MATPREALAATSTCRRASDVYGRYPKVVCLCAQGSPSAAAQLDQFLSRNAVASDKRVTVISDDAGEFEKAVQGSQLARSRILDRSHIAMKFKTGQRSVFGSKMIAPLERE
jgi:hypothetical protein